MTRASENSEGDSKLSEERLYAEAKENADTSLASPPLAPGSLTCCLWKETVPCSSTTWQPQRGKVVPLPWPGPLVISMCHA